jgi:DNA-binding Lrp family transcriptional regulator
MSDSDKFPTDFVPVSRPLVEELGYQTAYIFGIVWNYCQMESGICNASHDTMANRAGMSRRSVITRLDELIKAGYIEDLTPDVRNAPHHLSTKIGVQKLHSKERVIKEETPTEEPERCKNPTHQNGVGMQNLHSGYAKNAHRGMQNLHKNRQSQETELIDTPNGVGSQKPPEIQVEKQVKENRRGEGPRWELMNEFIALSGIPIPKDKSSKYWWSQIGVIYEITQKDAKTGKKLMKEAFERLGRENVYDPGSLVKTIRQAMAMKTNKPKVRLT